MGNQSYKAVKYMDHFPKEIGFLTRLRPMLFPNLHQTVIKEHI